MGELGSRGLIDWSRAVIDSLARQLCQGHLRNPLWWLGRLPGAGCWWWVGVLPGWCGLEGHCDRARGSGHHGGTRLGMAFTRHLVRLRP